jgi:hypothetical protein
MRIGRRTNHQFILTHNIFRNDLLSLMLLGAVAVAAVNLSPNITRLKEVGNERAHTIIFCVTPAFFSFAPASRTNSAS